MSPDTGMGSANETPFYSSCERGTYFAYGSNMSSDRLAARVPSARPRGIARLAGWRLVFDKPGRDGTGKANLVSEAGAVVWGVLYAIDPDDWEVLDRFEPGYRRTRVRCERPDGSFQNAVSYVFDPAGARRLPRSAPPSDAYLAHVITGAREHGLPEAYVGELLESLGRRG